MIVWHTDTDRFEPGQWVKGKVQDFTMSSDGKYAAIGLMGAKSRVHSWEDTQVAVICRPPFFTALEIWIGGLCYSGAVFLSRNRLLTRGGHHKVYADNDCPFERITSTDEWPVPMEHDHVIDARCQAATGVDQQGREILIDRCRIFEVLAGEPRLLFDCNEYAFEEVIAPDWATRW